MSPGILGKKIGMTQVFRPDGQVVPVTVLKAGPCIVVQRKTPTTDGYDAVQLGLMEYAKKSRITKPETGHLKKSGGEGVKFLREFRLLEGTNGDLKPGDRVLADEFKPKEKVDVIGVSKGRGFAGVVKRHHFRVGLREFVGPALIGTCSEHGRVLLADTAKSRMRPGLAATQSYFARQRFGRSLAYSRWRQVAQSCAPLPPT